MSTLPDFSLVKSTATARRHRTDSFTNLSPRRSRRKPFPPPNFPSHPTQHHQNPLLPDYLSGIFHQKLCKSLLSSRHREKRGRGAEVKACWRRRSLIKSKSWSRRGNNNNNRKKKLLRRKSETLELFLCFRSWRSAAVEISAMLVYKTPMILRP